jgi:hypothetical protein
VESVRSTRWPYAIAASVAGMTTLGALVWIALPTPQLSGPAASAPPVTTPSHTPATAAGNRYHAGVPDLCALVDLALVEQQGFQPRDRSPSASSTASSCIIVLRLADAPALDPRAPFEPSRELVAIHAEAKTFHHDPRDAERTWQTRQSSLARTHRHDDQHIQQVAGLGAHAFTNSQATPAPRDRGIWSHGLYLWHHNLYLQVKVTSIGDGQHFTHAHTRSTATTLTVDLLTALHR